MGKTYLCLKWMLNGVQGIGKAKSRIGKHKEEKFRW